MMDGKAGKQLAPLEKPPRRLDQKSARLIFDSKTKHALAVL